MPACLPACRGCSCQPKQLSANNSPRKKKSCAGTRETSVIASCRRVACLPRHRLDHRFNMYRLDHAIHRALMCSTFRSNSRHIFVQPPSAQVSLKEYGSHRCRAFRRQYNNGVRHTHDRHQRNNVARCTHDGDQHNKLKCRLFCSELSGCTYKPWKAC